MKSLENNKIGIALSGGAAFGIAHIGVIKALEEFNIKPSIISGTSMGALIGAMYAKGIPILEIEKIANSFNGTKTIKLISLTLQKSGVISSENIKKFLLNILGNIDMEDLSIPFIAVSVDLLSGNMLYFNKGNLVDAIQASISIPGIFSPFEANNSLLVDGGVRENLPLPPLLSYNPDFIIGINVLKTLEPNKEGYFTEIDSSKKYLEKNQLNLLVRIADAIKQKSLKPFTKTPDISTVGIRSLKLLINEDSINKVKLTKPNLMIDINLAGLKIWEFWRAKEFIEIGYNSAKEQLKSFFNN